MAETGGTMVVFDRATSAEDLFAPNLKIYPNPFTGKVRIVGAVETVEIGKTGKAGETVLRVINAAGVIVHMQMMTSPDETIRLEHLPAGVYFFMVEKDGKTKTSKIVKIQ